MLLYQQVLYMEGEMSERLSFAELLELEATGLAAGEVVDDTRLVAGLLFSRPNDSSERWVRFNPNRHACTLVVRLPDTVRKFSVLSDCIDELSYIGLLNEGLPSDGTKIITLSPKGGRAVLERWFTGVPSLLYLRFVLDQRTVTRHSLVKRS